MPYLPNIPDYKPFYIQREGDSAASDTAQRWGMIIKGNPYPVFPNPKERYSVDWKDEDGLDIYDTPIRLDAMEFSVEFIILAPDMRSITGASLIRKQFDRFVGAVRGGYFSTYDAYAGIGLANVRYVGFTQSDYWQDGIRAGYIFSVQFACDSPAQRMTLSGGAIVSYQTLSYPTPFVPNISDYKPFYVQRMGASGALNTATAWGAVAKVEQPPVMPNAKPVFHEKNLDEDGNVGFAVARLQPIEFKVDFYMKAYADGTLGAEDILLSQILAFRSYLTGGLFLAYDSWTDFGKQKVEYRGGSVERFDAYENWARAIFSVQFRANDPTTNIVYENGNLVPESLVGLNDNVGTHLYSNEPYRLQAETNE